MDRSELELTEKFVGDHFLVTGGGNGITAEIIREISKNIKARFSIIGRTAIPSDIEELSKLDEAALDQKNWKYMTYLKEKERKRHQRKFKKSFPK